jgi:hypothetical protein
MTALNGKKIFGAGRFFGINNVSNATPARFVLPQDMSVTFKRGTKSLYGENQLAADVSGGELEVSGKVSYGTSNARVIADLLFGVGNATGQTLEADNELGTIATHAITVVNAATWTIDLGVVNTVNGKRYQRVASGSETAGVSYSVASGVYTFASGETGTTFKISYLYTSASAGETVSLTNQLMGKVSDFSAVFVFPWTNNSNVAEQDVLTLNSCIASDAEIATKMGDYAKPSFGFTAACDTNDTLGTFSFAEAS